jgi:pyridoxine kinase
MGELCGKADLILPNLTEAYFMLGEEYREDYDRSTIQDLLRRLCALGAKRAALTGVSYEKGKVGVEYYDSTTGEFFTYFNEHLPVAFHGTGDIFASAVVGGRNAGMSFEEALTVAVDFTLECIRFTVADENRRFYGVNFESALPYYVERLRTHG